jgi:hypothetical protein
MTYRAPSTRRSATQAANTFKPSRALSTSRASLLFGTALGISIAIAAAAPNQAWAADECGADVAGVALCTVAGNPYPSGIDYTGDAGEDITVILVGGGVPTAVDVTTVTNDGVHVLGSTGFDATVRAYAGASISSTFDGIDVNADDGDAVVLNEAFITASYYGITAFTDLGDSVVLNSGEIHAGDLGGVNTSAGVQAISAGLGNVSYVNNSGYIDVTTSANWAAGIATNSFTGVDIIRNGADIVVYNSGGQAYGLDAYGTNLGISINSEGDLEVHGLNNATGIYADSLVDVYVGSDGDIYAESDNANAFGIHAHAAGYLEIDVTGDVTSDVDNLTGVNTTIYAYGYTGVNLTVEGDVYASDGATATGIQALGTGGGIHIDVDGDVQAGDFIGTTDTNVAIGITASNVGLGLGGDIDITVDGDVNAFGQLNSTGVMAVSEYDISLDQTGDVNVYSATANAYGVIATGYSTDLSVDGDVTVSGDGNAFGVNAVGTSGAAIVDVSGNVNVFADNGAAYGVVDTGIGADSSVTVGDGVDVEANGIAGGVRIVSGVYNVSIDVSGDSTIRSDTSSAIGLLATSGTGDASVTTDGNLYVYGETVATGITESSGTGTVSANLTGDVIVHSPTATSTGAQLTSGTGNASFTMVGHLDSYGFTSAVGAVVVSGTADSSVDITGNVDVQGFSGTAVGLQVVSGTGQTTTAVAGDMDIHGAITATGIASIGSTYGEIDLTGNMTVLADTNSALGISGVSTAGDLDIEVTGNIDVESLATTSAGISATAAGTNSVYIDITGNMYVGGGFFGAGGTDAVGITAVGTENATVNVTGFMYAYGDYGSAVGMSVVALQNATTTLTGDSYINGETTATGMAVTGNNLAAATMIGGMEVHADTDAGVGITVTSLNDSTVDGSGSILVLAEDAAIGIRAVANDSVDVDFDGTVTVTSDLAGAYGAFGASTTGDTSVSIGDDIQVSAAVFGEGVHATSNGANAIITVDGNITVDAVNDAVGADGRAATGDVTINITGDSDIDSSGLRGFGVFALTGDDAYVTVTGNTTVEGNSQAYGIAAFATSYVEVDVAGDMDIYSTFSDADGIRATSSSDNINIEVVGNSDVEAKGDARGISATANAGTVYVHMTGNLDVGDALLEGLSAFGIYATASGDSSVVMDGDLYVYGDNGVGYGIAAVSGTGSASIDMTGDTYAFGQIGAAGLGVRAATGSGTITGVGDIAVISVSNDAVGAYASAVAGVTVDITGDIDVTAGARAGGVYALSTGDIDITVDGDVITEAQTSDAAGVFAQTPNGDIDIEVTGMIDVNAINGAVRGYGVYALSTNGDIDIDVDDIDINVDPLLGDGAGVYASTSAGVVTVNATGLINTVGIDVDGVDAYSVAGNVNVDVNAVTTAGDGSEGVFARSTTGDVDIDALGAINTSGDAASGLFALSFSGASDVSSAVSVTTTGDFSAGMLALSYTGDATATNNGDVTTSGDLSGGVVAVGGDTSNATSHGEVTTSGDASGGVFAASNTGDATAFSDAEINTTGEFSAGMGAISVQGDAFATNEDVITTTGDNSAGILSVAIAGVANVNNTLGHIETSGLDSDGIDAIGFDGVHVTNGNNTVITSGNSAVGIYGFSPDSYVWISSGTVNTTGDASDGIRGVSAGADATDYVTVLSGIVTTDGADSDGIEATSAAGPVNVTSYSVDTRGADSTGILVNAFLAADIDAQFTYTDGATSRGIDATSQSSTVTIESVSLQTNGATSNGIDATGFSGVTIDSTFVETFGADSIGIHARNLGGGLIDVGSYSVETVGANADGISVSSEAYYDAGAVLTRAGGVLVSSTYVEIHGAGGVGIFARSEGAGAVVSATSVQTYGAGSTGIDAWAYGYYDPAANVELIGDSFVSAGTVHTRGDMSYGIYSWSEGGDSTVLATLVITDGDNADAIRSVAQFNSVGPGYSGDVSVNGVGIFTYGDFSEGIDAFAAGGDVNIIATTVETFGAGSDAILATTDGQDASNSDNVKISTYGTIFSDSDRGIHVYSAGESNIYVESGSVYGGYWGIQSDSDDGTYIYNDGSLAGGAGQMIDIDGAAGFVQNNGNMYGFVDMTDNADHIEQDGYWDAYGTSTFGAGVDDIDNDGFLSFGVYHGAASTTTFTGLEFFDNSSIINSVDNQVNDQLVMTGTSFTGTVNSTLQVDAELGGPGSAADRLFIGSAQGSTLIVPFDLLAGQPGALNFGGILVVDSANAAEVGDEFSMDNVDKGFIEYSLFFDAAADNWLIVGLPDQEVFELLGAMSSSQDFWRRSGDAISARWQETRDAMGDSMASAGPGGIGRSDGWELWMQAHGGDESFDNVETIAINGFTFTPDLTADTDWRGFQFGFDNLQGNTLWGLTMGFNQQETKFDFDGNSYDTEGWNIGGYFGWASNGFFMNGLVKGDFFEQDANFHTLPSIFTFDGVTWGAQGEFGFRWGGDGFFVEPIASLAWNTTELDSVTTGGATIDFDDATSLLGRAGARIGGTWGDGDVVLTPYIGVYAVEEWEGDNTLTFTTGPTSITFSDQGRGSYGMADFGFTMQTFYGLEGFVKGEWNFGGDADGGAVRLGARWRW